MAWSCTPLSTPELGAEAEAGRFPRVETTLAFCRWRGILATVDLSWGQLRDTCCSTRNPKFSSSTQVWRLTTTCNLHSRKRDGFFWLPGAPVITCKLAPTDTHICNSRAWKDGSVVNTDSLSKDKDSSQHSHGCSQPFITAVSWSRMPLSDLCWQHMHMVHRHSCT